MIQEQFSGKEFLLGIKKTPEFSHVLGFGRGGTDTEKFDDVSFRVCPLIEEDYVQMINQIEFSRGLKSGQVKDIISVLKKLNSLVEKYPEIEELDINPLMVSENDSVIVDVRIVK